MSDQVESLKTEPQKIVALKFRTHFERQSAQDDRMPCNRFADVEQVMDDIFRNDKLRCA